jgi:hypothetical protein
VCANPKCGYCPNSVSVCLSCFGSNRDITNNCACLPGYADPFVAFTPADYSCVLCTNIKCLSCLTTNLATCIQCIGNNRDMTNSCSCLAGYFDELVPGSPGTYDCVACFNPKCGTCPTLTPSSCSTCINANRDMANSCNCLAGYYDSFSASNPTSFTCTPCNNPRCSACPTGPSSCTACFGLYRNITYACACNAGYYD